MQERLHTMEEEEGTSTHEDFRYLAEEYATHELKSSDCDTGGIRYEWHEELSIDGGQNVRFKLDSGRLSPGPRVRIYGARGGYLNVMGVFEGVVK